jgi:hypothetical protein
MVGQPGKAGTEEYIEKIGFITEENGTLVRDYSDKGAFLLLLNAYQCVAPVLMTEMCD